MYVQVPRLFVSGRYVGSEPEIQRLHQSGELAHILKEATAPDLPSDDEDDDEDEPSPATAGGLEACDGDDGHDEPDEPPVVSTLELTQSHRRSTAGPHNDFELAAIAEDT